MVACVSENDDRKSLLLYGLMYNMLEFRVLILIQTLDQLFYLICDSTGPLQLVFIRRLTR